MPSLTQKAAYIDIYQKAYHHDIAQINFLRSSEVWFKDIPTGLPVTITWTQQRQRREWVGYVTHVEKTVKPSLEQPLVIHCVGASYLLKEKATRVFTGMSIPDAVKIICTQFGLALVTDAHPVKFSQLTMAGHSYWEWLVEHAKKIGYVLYMEGAVLHFRKLERMVNRSVSSSALLYYSGLYVKSRVDYYDRTLHYFKVLKGDNIETSGALRSNKLTAGVNPIMVKSQSAESSPQKISAGMRTTQSDVLFSEYRTDQVAQTASVARELSRGAASMARLNLPAKVKCIGDSRISPFAPVRVSGTGAKTDGLWVASEVRHNLRSNGEYDIEAVIVTDGVDGTLRTSLRPEVTDQYGFIDIDEAVRTKNNQKTVSTQLLVQGNAGIRPQDKGFNKDKMRWRAGGVVNG
jgi:phage protein D